MMSIYIIVPVVVRPVAALATCYVVAAVYMCHGRLTEALNASRPGTPLFSLRCRKSDLGSCEWEKGNIIVYRLMIRNVVCPCAP